MKIYAISILFFVVTLFASCVSTKSTLKNVDDNAPIPKLTKDNTFVITEYSKDSKYGYHPDYPINLFYKNTFNVTINQQRYLNALAGPNGELLSFKKLESCCPFPTKRSNDMGAGFLEVYEVSWEGMQQPIRLYLNIYEKGGLMAPIGLSIKQK